MALTRNANLKAFFRMRFPELGGLAHALRIALRASPCAPHLSLSHVSGFPHVMLRSRIIICVTNHNCQHINLWLVHLSSMPIMGHTAWILLWFRCNLKPRLPWSLRQLFRSLLPFFHAMIPQ